MEKPMFYLFFLSVIVRGTSAQGPAVTAAPPTPTHLCLTCSYQPLTSLHLADEKCVTSPLAISGTRVVTCRGGCMLSRADHPGELCNYGRGAPPTSTSTTPGHTAGLTTPFFLRPHVLTTPSSPTCPKASLPRDCEEVLRHDVAATSGRYYIYPSGVRMSVWCDMDAAGGGWTMIQLRFNGSVDFYRDWEDYKRGFGLVNGGEFWLGNTNIHILTFSDGYEVRLDMADVNGPSFAEFEHFAVADELSKYQLSVSGYKPSSIAGAQLDNGMYFSATNKDHDTWGSSCSALHSQGGWWYKTCGYANLNGRYGYNTEDRNKYSPKWMFYYHMKKGVVTGYPLRSSSMKLRKFYRPKDCWDIQERFPRATSGVYTVYLGAETVSAGTPVYCDMDTDGGGWTTILRRHDGSVDFYRNFADYEKGVGDVYGEHFLGLRSINILSTQRQYELRVDLESSTEKKFAKYSEFSVGDASEQYRLHVWGYYASSTAGDSLKIHNKQQFSAKDKGTSSTTCGNCAVSSKGGWWYDCCHTSNLLGAYGYTALNQGHVTTYGSSVIWASFMGQDYSLRVAHMKLRPQLPCETNGAQNCTGSTRCFNDMTRGVAVCH